MTVLSDAFAAARAEDRALLIGYLPAGYPSYDGAVDAIGALVENGVDVVEVGLPYSDPLMDGPVIQQAVEAALAGGIRTSGVLATAAATATLGAAALVMTYWNPVERYGTDRFAADLAAGGVSGVITPDLIPEEAGPWLAAAAAHDLDSVFLVAPSSTDARIASTAAVTRGFVYAASTMGVTGARTAVAGTARVLVDRVRRHTDLPVAVGLGVSTGAQASEVASYADGVIVGSALVRCLLDTPGPAGIASVGALARELADGVRSARHR